MSSSRWLSLTLGAGFLVLTSLALFNVWADPTGRWRTGTFPLRDGETALTKAHRLGGFYSSNATVLIMGSSRVALLNWPRTINGQSTQVIATLDASMADQLDLFSSVVGSDRVKCIYLGLDFMGFVHGLEIVPERRIEKVAKAAESLFHYRNTIDSWKLVTRPDDWSEPLRSIVDWRTGHMLRHTTAYDFTHAEKVLAFYRGRIAAAKASEHGLTLTPGLDCLDEVLQVAKEHGIEVRLFFNPISNQLISVYREEGVWELLLLWKTEVQARHPAVDLLREWPEEMQSWFSDPAHVKNQYSPWVMDNLGLNSEPDTLVAP